MTAETVSIIIIIKAGEKTAEIQKDIPVDDLEKTTASLGVELNGDIFSKILELLDDHIQESVPGSWKNIGREKRSLVFEHGLVYFRRRVYRDEDGMRRKPLDELLDIQPYDRNSRSVQEIGSVMAADTTYRKAAQLLSYLLKTHFSPASVHRMVKKLGQCLEEQEKTFVSSQPGTIPACVLNAESDGVWIHLQGKKKKRAEVKVGLMYTGKKQIGKKRFRCENKVVMTQLGGTTLEWQLKLRELADRTYDLANTRMLVVGGDGSTWVKRSFDMLCLPQTHLLDRFHVVRDVKRAFGSDLNTDLLFKELFAEGLDAVQTQLQGAIQASTGKLREKRCEVYRYLVNNQDALIDLDKRPGPDLSYVTLGASEGNVDKLVRQRMKGRGLSWSIPGAISMLAILRHKQELFKHSFRYVPVPKKQRSPNRVKVAQTKQVYIPISGSLPIFHGSNSSEPWVQLLRKKLNYGLSINAYF